MRILKTLAVGIQGRGRWPLEQAKPERGFEIVGLCDLDASALQKERELLGLPKSSVYTNLEEAMLNSGAEVAIICTPTVHHAPMTRQALEQGLSVLVEKGMAPNWTSAKAMVAHAEPLKSGFCVAQNYRYGGVAKTITRVLHQPNDPHHPGALHQLDYWHHRVRPVPRTLTYPHASIWDMSCHHFDNMLSWLGPARSVHAFEHRAAYSAYEHPANTIARIQFECGTWVNYFHGHDASRGELRIGLHGERGAIMGSKLDETAGDFGDMELSFTPRSHEQFGVCPSEIIPKEAHLGEAGVLADFHRYVCEGIEPGISGRHNLEVMALCSMVVQSIETGHTVWRKEVT